MDFLHLVIDFILHIEVHLDYLIQTYHAWTYLILFMIIFCETGVVVLPFLPGDSLLFAIGAFAARGSFDFWTISLTLLVAAILGDSLNYTIGKYVGPKVFYKNDSKFFNKGHLLKAQAFYEKYGAKTIIIARFIPIVRTFAPFVAGIGEMTYKKFMTYNVVGAVSWIFIFIPLGYFFGNLAFVQQNFKLVMIAIIVISVLPPIIEYLRERSKK
ncbi:DedA family protein [Bacteriovorax sp. PP10]|uniref:DedA family protein n=1 Tax=Bacteriovorax antarcticus TaxID=3088717 RepID=A0ABU5VSW2_9BACT|nr:DedA family protein [Bacteriovorax sp. PP10]MEA9356141.1 DedA family protein [Bacteriovorax sp. PP10]